MRIALKLLRLPPRDGLMLSEAFLSLVFFRLCLLVVPVRRIVGWLGKPATELLGSHAPLIHRVQWAILAVARHSPLEFVCFPQALAGLWMLRRRNIPSTLIYGVAKSDTNQLIAHTWLEVEAHIILGGEAAPQFTPLDLPPHASQNS